MLAAGNETTWIPFAIATAATVSPRRRRLMPTERIRRPQCYDLQSLALRIWPPGRGIDAGDVAGARPLTGFIWRPDKWSAVVAVLAGCAGVLSQIGRVESAELVDW
jgi:hypothetical protein